MQKHQNAESKVIQAWKVAPIIKGALTWVPPLNTLRLRRASTGAADSPRYCYSVWLRHLITLDRHGFRIKGVHVGELGPGESIGVGLAALLSGAARYVGLDIVPFSARADLTKIFDDLVNMYSRREPIPDHNEFPLVRPRLDSYEFPNHLIDWTDFIGRSEKIRSNLRSISDGRFISYRAPWTSLDDVTTGSLDLVFSQAVLEHVDAIQETYQAMFAWLKPAGYAFHVIDFSSHGLSPFWNGHWAYSDWQWRLVRGRREFLLNRAPLGTHLACAENAGFQVLLLTRDYADDGIKAESLSRRFQFLDNEDARTRGAILILRKR